MCRAISVLDFVLLYLCDGNRTSGMGLFAKLSQHIVFKWHEYQGPSIKGDTKDTSTAAQRSMCWVSNREAGLIAIQSTPSPQPISID